MCRFPVWLVAAILVAAGCSNASELRLSEARSEVTVVPASGNFGDLDVGTTSSPLNIVVGPTGVGNSYTEVTNVTEDCPNFSVSSLPTDFPAEVSRTCDDGSTRIVDGARPQSTLLPSCTGGYTSVEYSFSATFSPTVAGMQSCVVNIIVTAGSKTVTLMGNGLPPPRDVDLSRASVAFGDVRKATSSSDQTIVVSNTGTGDLTITSAAVSGTGFSMTGATSVIAGNSSYPYSVKCAPPDVGQLSGSFTIVSNDPDEGTVSIPLSCNGVDSALDVQPSPIAMPAARVAEPRELTVRLTNSGGAEMMNVSASITGTDLQLVNPPTGNIAANGFIDVRVRYMASSEADINGMLSVQFDGNQTRTVAVSARSKVAALSISPDGEVDLGAVCVGSTKDRSFVALGTGGAPFTISTVRVAGEGFSLTTGAGPLPVAGAGATTTTLTARAAPTQPGAMTGAMTLTTDIPNGAPRIVNLTGAAIAQGIGAAPTEVDFSAIQVNEPSSVQTISIANCSGTALSISNTALEGPDAADFRIITEPARTVAPAESANLLIEMRPRTKGPKTATLVITHSGGTTSVPLIGDGFLKYVPAPRIGTYYACSAQGDSGTWMIGVCLVALGLLRRRRGRS
jgi:hypothetical protein